MLCQKKGIDSDKEKTKVIMIWSTPSTVTEVCSFLEFTNYYKRFIEKYAQVAKPFFRLLWGENANRKSKHIVWTLQSEASFNKLKDLCTLAPILTYADFEKHSKMHTDACGIRLGVMLYQEKGGIDKIVSYAS